MNDITLEDFQLAASEIAHNGDNDTLPFDADVDFIREKHSELAQLAFDISSTINSGYDINQYPIFSERLLASSGPNGFRMITKIHPFWNIYLNGLAIAIAKKNEPKRNPRAHSYRFAPKENYLFDKQSSWRSYKQSVLADNDFQEGSYVVQTDIANFYERIYHHNLENCIKNLFNSHSKIAYQVDRILRKITAGKSFGLPIGGQASRIFAEVLMTTIDQALISHGMKWHRYVDDITIIVDSPYEAYKALSDLSYTLSDYGLSLNRMKTNILPANQYREYIHTQLGLNDECSLKLETIDLYFDPYSDNAETEYEDLKKTVQSIDIHSLLNSELDKSQPDTFVVAQISRTLKLHETDEALRLITVLLNPSNLYAFRGSWSKIMKAINLLRCNDNFLSIHNNIDLLLDAIPDELPHLLKPETNLLYFLKTIRYESSEQRAQFVQKTYNDTDSQTVKIACIDCWRYWSDSPKFEMLKNKWSSIISTEEARIVWLSSYKFGDSGRHFRKSSKSSLENQLDLNINCSKKDNQQTKSFSEIYIDWAQTYGTL